MENNTTETSQNPACHGCAVRLFCTSGQNKERTVNLKAVFICYVLPMILLVGLLALGTKLWGELPGILLSLGSLIPYYTILYLLRNKTIITKISTNV